MEKTLKGVLIEYGSDFLGPIPNVVVFQFNPEKLARTIEIPPRPVNATTRETSQAGEPPYERFTVEAQFSAADQRNSGNVLGLTMGVGPQLAALEAMVYPVETQGGLIGAAVGAVVDAVGSLLGGSSGPDPTQSVPRVASPKILFIWGLTRVVPVIVESMTINEIQYDALLNPEEASVTIGLAVVTPCNCCDDKIASGALSYTKMMQDTMASLNLANAVVGAADLIQTVTRTIASTAVSVARVAF